MNGIIDAYGKEGIHVILDNLNTHKPRTTAGSKPSQRASALYAHPHFLA
jgi:hypothetical protein